MQAILTKFVPPTNSHGQRIKVWSETQKCVVTWDDSQDVADNYRGALKLFLEKFGIYGDPDHWHAGLMPDQTGYCFVYVKGVHYV